MTFNLFVLPRGGKMGWGNFLGRGGLKRRLGKPTECIRRSCDITFPLVLICLMAAFEGWESDSDSESEESSEEDGSTTGFFTTGFGAGFVFKGSATCGEGACERGSSGAAN